MAKKNNSPQTDFSDLETVYTEQVEQDASGTVESASGKKTSYLIPAAVVVVAAALGIGMLSSGSSDKPASKQFAQAKITKAVKSTVVDLADQAPVIAVPVVVAPVIESTAGGGGYDPKADEKVPGITIAVNAAPTPVIEVTPTGGGYDPKSDEKVPGITVVESAVVAQVVTPEVKLAPEVKVVAAPVEVKAPAVVKVVEVKVVEPATTDHAAADEARFKAIEAKLTALSGEVASLKEKNAALEAKLAAVLAKKTPAKKKAPKIHVEKIAILGGKSLQLTKTLESVAAAQSPAVKLALTAYRGSAIVPDRAWFLAEDGTYFSLAIGDELPGGYGLIKTIDANTGVVVFSSGEKISFW